MVFSDSRWCSTPLMICYRCFLVPNVLSLGRRSWYVIFLYRKVDSWADCLEVPVASVGFQLRYQFAAAYGEIRKMPRVDAQPSTAAAVAVIASVMKEHRIVPACLALMRLFLSVTCFDSRLQVLSTILKSHK